MSIVSSFSWYHCKSSKHTGDMGGFKTVMQTRDTVKGLHNCREIIIFEKYFIKAIGDFFHVYTKPHLNTRGVGRILDSYANP